MVRLVVVATKLTAQSEQGSWFSYNPLHGSGRAGFPHRALALGDNTHAAQGVVMIDANRREPATDQPPHAIPGDTAVLTAPRERAIPEPADLKPEDVQRPYWWAAGPCDTLSKVPSSEELWGPHWSVDGRYIVAIPRAGDRLMLFDVKTQKWTELAKTKPGAGWEGWSREGNHIYCSGAPPNGQRGVFRVRISDRRLEQVVSLKDFAKLLSAKTGWS